MSLSMDFTVFQDLFTIVNDVETLRMSPQVCVLPTPICGIYAKRQILLDFENIYKSCHFKDIHNALIDIGNNHFSKAVHRFLCG